MRPVKMLSNLQVISIPLLSRQSTKGLSHLQRFGVFFPRDIAGARHIRSGCPKNFEVLKIQAATRKMYVVAQRVVPYSGHRWNFNTSKVFWSPLEFSTC